MARGLEWLTPSQLRAINLIVRALKRAKTVKAIHRKTAITLFILDRMEKAAGAYPNYYEFFALCRTAHDGLLRGGEFRTLIFRQLS